MTKTMFLLSFSLTLAACSKSSGGGSTCERAVDNTVAILKKEMPDVPAGDRGDMLAKCQKLPADKQQCGADAKDLQALMACGK